MMNHLRVLAKNAEGILSYIPFLYSYLKESELFGVAGSTSSASYCYNVFWRHIQKADEMGVDLLVPRGNVVELGPGGSLGTGLCAILAGYERYVGVDVVPFAKNRQRNLMVFEELRGLFEMEASLVQDNAIWPIVGDLNYPAKRIRAIKAGNALSPARLQAIRQAIQCGSAGSISLSYCHPDEIGRVFKPDTVDWVFSQAVLEHVEDIGAVHSTMARVLRLGGWASHTIDFKAHGCSVYYNGHYRYSEAMWRFMVGRRVLLSNRKPPSAHIAAVEAQKMKVIGNYMRRGEDPLPKSKFHQDFRQMTDDDAYASSAFLLAGKT